MSWLLNPKLVGVGAVAIATRPLPTTTPVTHLATILVTRHGVVTRHATTPVIAATTRGQCDAACLDRIVGTMRAVATAARRAAMILAATVVAPHAAAHVQAPAVVQAR